VIEKVVHGLMSGDWKRGTASGPQRLQSDAWTAPDLSTTAPALDSGPAQPDTLTPRGRPRTVLLVAIRRLKVSYMASRLYSA